MPPGRKRTPTASNGSPLAETAGPSGHSRSPTGPSHPLAPPTSPLAMSGTHHLKRPPLKDPIYAKVKGLSENQRLFLVHNFDKVSHKPTKLQYYDFIRLFNPKTKSRPSDKKESLKAAYIKEVRPLLKSQILPPVSTTMETNTKDVDFDPLGRKTTKKMLIDAIEKKDPYAMIPTGATIDDVLVLYKHYVDPQLNLPVKTRFNKRPRTIPMSRLKGESMEDILLALRYAAPCVFVRLLSMNKSTLMDLYIKFVHDKTPSSTLILGFHYTILDLSASDFPDSMDHRNGPRFEIQTHQPHQVVCVCKAYECGDQEYPDTNGIYHPGVEVLPETRAAHQRADRRNNLLEPTNNISHSIQGSTPSAQDDLLLTLNQLQIGSPPSSSQDHQIHHETTTDIDENCPQEHNSPSTHNLDSLSTHTARQPTATSQSPSKECSKAVLAKASDHFHSFEMRLINPLILHVALTTAILDIFGRSSNSITTWILDVQSITIKVSSTWGILPTKSQVHQLIPEEIKTINQIPASVSTAFGWLRLDPMLTYMNCCNSCFTMYPETRVPSRCHHCISAIPGGPPDSVNPVKPVNPNNPTNAIPPSSMADLEPDFSEKICGAPLLKYEEKIEPISTAELLRLVAEHSEPIPYDQSPAENPQKAELEITFLKQFCRASNLLALIEDGKLPDALNQYTSRIQALYRPLVRRSNKLSHSKLSPLSDTVLNLMIKYLNGTKNEGCIWLRPNDWALLPTSESIGYSPLQAQAQFHKCVKHGDGFVSTFTNNPDNCCIHFKNSENTDGFA
ncbi:uncharacterized protein MELLADRAFT_105982 [Melampsora larici-populina 98AG31]|uniref:Uncharacterized protein n=1 Tax=Melampsora larici-populina (strain 98AG31 / pathotype 3-4-7) TaxID=747676 RepID=F4RJZ3_MELLP|nr:uncharacterized protein MELLADRAFT_105982 [Melampsora larici-populina 98AG31]EGG07412.1 hypothetical protein MELLADRAFT_105982 [Melampsora larici-populina 98AG31]